jgi:hypothetical protein
MSSTYDEQLELQRMLPGRPESPALEGEASLAIERSFRELIEGKYLYQKTIVDLAEMDRAIRASVAKEEEVAQRAAAVPPIGGGGPVRVKLPTPVTPARLEELRKEVATRPWRFVTRHQGDNPQAHQIFSVSRIGGQPIGTPLEDVDLSFYLPAVQLRCPARCKGLSTFIALASSATSHFESPFPRRKNGETEQVFFPYYRCEMCRETLYTLLIRRTGLRLHLCGFAPRREPFTSRAVPEALAPILSDAEQAVAEGDIFAGFYHLRTLLEHYLKGRLTIPITTQIRGDELVEKHYASISKELGSVLPSVTVAYERLSESLHSRTGGAEDYKAHREAICKHIEALALLSPSV